MDKVLKIKYILEDDNMTDEEFENQEQKEFILTQTELEMIIYRHLSGTEDVRIEEMRVEWIKD